MLRRLQKIVGFKAEGTDGEVGEARDLYFDDQEWVVRYFVVETGPWLARKWVLIAPACMGAPDWEAERLSVGLTKQQVADSPDIDLHKPVSRQQLQSLHGHYGWAAYWGDGEMGYWPPARLASPAEQKEEPKGDPHLRSVNEVTGYHIQATDGDIGHVVDLFADDGTWRIEYMVVDTRNWLPGKQVIVSPDWISKVSWAERKVHVNVTRAKVKDSPEFDPLPGTCSRDYEVGLYGHYGFACPPRWTEPIKPSAACDLAQQASGSPEPG
ncbi:MAG: PRC-barrel domain containing protein [Anaerolineaceae bacterium]|nr:PRC-barrel domain containing protein [Anaerolineaceae bacterium]